MTPETNALIPVGIAALCFLLAFLYGRHRRALALRRRVAVYAPCSRAYCPVCFPSIAYILSFRLYISILYLTKSSLWTILF